MKRCFLRFQARHPLSSVPTMRRSFFEGRTRIALCFESTGLDAMIDAKKLRWETRIQSRCKGTAAHRSQCSGAFRPPVASDCARGNACTGLSARAGTHASPDAGVADHDRDGSVTPADPCHDCSTTACDAPHSLAIPALCEWCDPAAEWVLVDAALADGRGWQPGGVGSDPLHRDTGHQPGASCYSSTYGAISCCIRHCAVHGRQSRTDDGAQ